MPSQSKSHPGRILAMLPAMIAVLCTCATLAVAQDRPVPKGELFGGYSFFHAGADVHGQLPGALFPISSRLEPNPRGFGGSVTYNFNRWLGLTLDGSHHLRSGESTACGVCKVIDDASFSNLSLGPKVTLRRHRFSLFFEGLVGAHRLWPEAFHHVTKLGFMAGGGLDINLSRHFALRLLRADYVYSNYRFGSAAVTPETKIRGVRLQTGLVFMFGGGTPPPPPPPPNRSPVVSCSAEQSTANAGDVVAVRAQASDPDNDSLTYTWTTNGGAVEGSGPEVRWSSSGTTPGTYAVKVRVNDGRGGTADCSVDIRVEPRPNRAPSLTCSVERSSVRSGERVRIRAVGSDPDGDSLTYSWRASGGQIIGSGPSVQLDTSGLSAGAYSVAGRVEDGRGGAADCSTSVGVEALPAPPQASKLNECFFRHASARVDNVCKRILDDVAIRLQNDPRARVVFVGYADPKEPRPDRLAGQRSDAAKAYLAEKGIAGTRVDVRTAGGQAGADKQNRRIDVVWVPEGATY
jgi:outer membrane protein OmpA-like peptidoglycan-associated protein/opacity protein-like surface antigen